SLKGTERALGRSAKEHPPWDVDSSRDRLEREHAGRGTVGSAICCGRKHRSRRTRGNKKLRLCDLQPENQKHGENGRSEHVAPSTKDCFHLLDDKPERRASKPHSGGSSG